jgi:hypothetical protein
MWGWRRPLEDTLNVSLLLQSLSLSLSLSVKVSEILHTEREVTAKWTKNGRRKEKSDNWEKKIGE